MQHKNSEYGASPRINVFRIEPLSLDNRGFIYYLLFKNQNTNVYGDCIEGLVKVIS